MVKKAIKTTKQLRSYTKHLEPSIENNESCLSKPLQRMPCLQVTLFTFQMCL